MHALAAARMRVPSRRTPLPLEEVERRLTGLSVEQRALVLHNAGYTELSFKDAVGRRDWLNSDLFKNFERHMATRPERKRMQRKRKGRWWYGDYVLQRMRQGGGSGQTPGV